MPIRQTKIQTTNNRKLNQRNRELNQRGQELNQRTHELNQRGQDFIQEQERVRRLTEEQQNWRDAMIKRCENEEQRERTPLKKTTIMS